MSCDLTKTEGCCAVETDGERNARTYAALAASMRSISAQVSDLQRTIDSNMQAVTKLTETSIKLSEHASWSKQMSAKIQAFSAPASS